MCIYYVEQHYIVHSGDYLELKSPFKMWRQLFQCHQLNYKVEKLISNNLDNQNIFIQLNIFLLSLSGEAVPWLDDLREIPWV